MAGEKNCDTCEFYRPVTAYRGECRKHAPYPVHYRYHEDEGIDIAARWPALQRTEWCGEWSGPTTRGG